MKTKHLVLLFVCVLTGLIILNFVLIKKDVVISQVTHQGCHVRFIAENKTMRKLSAIIAVDIASVEYKGQVRKTGGERFSVNLDPLEQKTIEKNIDCVSSGNVWDVNVVETKDM